MKRFILTRIFFYLALALFFCANGQGVKYPLTRYEWSQMTPRQRLRAMTFTTPAYRQEALQLIIKEANRVAQELNLPEQLPITETNIVEAFIDPPGMAKLGIGNITTSNYVYYISVGDKFSYLVRTHLEQQEHQLMSQYRWPMRRVDTNAAYQLAVQFLKAASMDVNLLNINCDLQITSCLPEGENGKHFVPIYWVTWAEKDGGRGVASIELCQPTKIILQMRFNKSEYILRKPVVITNLNFLLSQTNAVPQTNALSSP